LLGTEPFIAVNGDIWTDADFAALPAAPIGLAHLLLVDNPPQHPHGDFVLDAHGIVHDEGTPRLTFSGIGVYRHEVLRDWQAVIGDASGVEAKPPRFRLVPLLRAAMETGAVSGSHHHGAWTDVGTPERLAQLETTLSR
jgi:MurNAc alpha-1-phosphate uridylyltransferase